MTNTAQIAAPLVTLAFAAVGAGLFSLIGFPAPFLTGPALVVSLAALAGINVSIPNLLRDLCFLTVGVGIGTSVTPDVVMTALTWPLSFAVLTSALIVTLALAPWILRARFGFDGSSAFLASIPGHMSYVLSLGLERNVDIARVSLVQSIRVLSLTLIVPMGLALWGVEGDVRMQVPERMAALPMLGTFALAGGLGFLFLRVRLPAAFLLGGITISAALHLSGLGTGALPPELTVSAFTVMGALIGTRFIGQSFASLRVSVGAGGAITVLTTVLAAGAALLVAWWLDLPVALLLIAFSPGALEAMAAMAVQIGVDPAFVAAHHVFRLLILTLIIPAMMPRG